MIRRGRVFSRKRFNNNNNQLKTHSTLIILQQQAHFGSIRGNRFSLSCGPGVVIGSHVGSSSSSITKTGFIDLY